MNRSTSGNDKFTVQRGLGRTLLLCFLAFPLVPVTVVSIISYHNAYESLKRNAQDSLESVATIKTSYINLYFSRMLADMEEQAGRVSNRHFLEDLGSAFKKSGKPLADFVNSRKWALIADEPGADLKTFRKTYGYHDLFLTDSDGNVLFSLAGESDLGTNLFNGRYAGTHFARACKKSLDTGRPAFSDFDSYEPSNNALAGFLASVIVNDAGEKIGLFALQIPIGPIDAIMKEKAGIGETEETYIIGADLKRRSGSSFLREDTVLETTVDTEQARLWQKDRTETETKPETMEDQSFIYGGPHGKPVLGTHHAIKLAGVPLAVIAEIEEAEAFAPAKRLLKIVIILLSVTAIVVLLLAWSLTRRIVSPIRNMTDWSRKIAEGDFSYAEIRAPANEIGTLNHSFREAVTALRQAESERERNAWLNTGHSGLDDQMRGEQAIETLCRNIITFIANYLEVQVGTLYVNEGNGTFKLMASYAYKTRKNLSNEFKIGEGLIGQVALEKQAIVLTNVPEDYVFVMSGLGEKRPKNILVIPFLYNETVMAILEIGSLQEFSELQTAFLEEEGNGIAIAVNAALSRVKLNGTLEKTQQLAEKLVSQQEELKAANEELEEQTRRLKASEEQLKSQQEELRLPTKNWKRKRMPSRCKGKRS